MTFMASSTSGATRDAYGRLIERQMVAVFADHNVGQQSWGGQAAVGQPLGQRGDERSAVAVGAMNVFLANGAPPQEAARFVIE